MEKWPETKHFVLEEKESEEAVDGVFTSNLSSSTCERECESDTVTRKKRREFKKELTAMIVSVWA